MSDSNANNSSNAPHSAVALDAGTSPWQRLKTRRIAYLTLPLLIMATVVEYVILATGWNYQKAVCVPQGMGVTFFGIGPIGATILAVELLKLPLAIWTASRMGWQKKFMLFAGLPLICVLTFQLVKDMAVYEMSIAMKPASEMLEKASAEEIKISHLKGELTAIEAKKTNRQQLLAELTAKKAKAKAELEEALKRIDETRQDAITLTDYQKKELAEEESRQAAITKQFNADSDQLTKALAELRARREVELPTATKWGEEEARIENAYKTKLAAYTNKKSAYEKDKADYDNAGFMLRQLMREPVDPGVPPEREVNKILKPTTLMAIEAQITAKEAELLAVNNKRRERIAQVGDGAQRLRQEFDTRSRTKREEADRKRDELLAAHTALTKEWSAEEKQMDAELAAAVQNVDGLRAEVDACRKVAEKHYEAREAAIRNTQVHRIATTVEIVRGLLFGERPMSITASARERGDVLTDQISMVRIWVYPVLAFIVAFLPTLMVEIGFATAFHPDSQQQQRPPHRLGFLGQRLHALYIRAGRQKILRAERRAAHALGELASRDKALATVNSTAERALAEKDVELQAAREALAAATTTHEEQLAWMAADHAEQMERLEAERADQVNRLETESAAQAKQSAADHAATVQRLEAERAEQANQLQAAHEQHLKQKEAGWVAKFTSLAESLNRSVAEKDAMRETQHAEVERQVQTRQSAWSERVNQLRQELDTRHAAHEAERAALIQEHHLKLREISESAKTQIAQARRQAADAELAAQEATARLTFDLKQSQEDREVARVQLLQQTESLTLKLSQAREEAAREIGQALRDEKYRSERLQLEFDKTLRERNEEFARQIKQREQELALEAETRLAKERTLAEQDARRRDAEFERQLEAKTREVDARWTQELQQREEAVQIRLKQQEQQLQAQAAQELRRRESELQRQLDTQAREADARVKQEVSQRELALQARLQQREQELAAKAVARETELQNQWAEASRTREQEWERQAEARVRATETRLVQEARQKEELIEIKSRQREQQLQAQFEARQSEWQTETQHFQRRHQEESASATTRALRELEVQLRQEMQQKETAAQVKARQREQDLLAQLAAQNQSYKQAQHQWETELLVMRRNIEPLNALLARTAKERDEAKQSATEHFVKVQDMEKKLTEASSLLTGWKLGNGKHSDPVKAGRDVLQASRAVMTGDHES
jgi:hypothetical protein